MINDSCVSGAQPLAKLEKVVRRALAGPRGPGEGPPELRSASYVPRASFVVRATETLPIVAAARDGLGIALLPCSLGDSDPALSRAHPEPVATTRVWMVVHPDVQRAARVRLLLDHLVAFFKKSAPLFRGERPRRSPG